MVFEHLVLYMQTSSGLISKVWNETKSNIHKVVSFQRNITKAMLSANSFSIQAQILLCSKQSLKWNHEKVIEFQRNNTKPMVLFTLFVICAKIIMFSEESFKWNHNWMVSLQTKTKKPTLLCSGPFSFKCQISKFSQIWRNVVVMFFVPLDFNFSSPPTPVWISSLFHVFVTTFGQIWDQSILQDFRFGSQIGFAYKSNAFTRVLDASIVKPKLLPLYFTNIQKYKKHISTVCNETISNVQKVVSLQNNNTKPMVWEHPL